MPRNSRFVEIHDEETGRTIAVGRNARGRLCGDCAECAKCGRMYTYTCAGFRPKGKGAGK